MEDTQISEYFQNIKQLRNALRAGAEALNTKWFEVLPPNKPLDWTSEELPALLALIHPDYCIDNNGQKIVHDNYKRKKFNHDPTDRCQIGKLVEGVKCPYQSEFQKSHADHLWPYSLGGLTESGNKLSLCDVCNRAKSNSPFLFPGDDIPRWLRLYVVYIANKKNPLLHLE